MPRKAASQPATAPPAPLEVPSDYFDDEWVEIYPADGMIPTTARALLACADLLGYPDPARAVVAVGGGFRVPQPVLDAVTLPTEPDPTPARVIPTPLAAIGRGALPDPEPATDAAP